MTVPTEFQELLNKFKSANREYCKYGIDTKKQMLLESIFSNLKRLFDRNRNGLFDPNRYIEYFIYLHELDESSDMMNIGLRVIRTIQDKTKEGYVYLKDDNKIRYALNGSIFKVTHEDSLTEDETIDVVTQDFHEKFSRVND